MEHPNDPFAVKARKKLEELKESLRIVRLYSGAPLPRERIAVIACTMRDVYLSEENTKASAMIIQVDEKEIYPEYTKEIECLPGTHTISFLLGSKPANMPEGAPATSIQRYEKTVELKAGSKYLVGVDPDSPEVSIIEMLQY